MSNFIGVKFCSTGLYPMFKMFGGRLERSIKQHCAESGVGWVTAMHKACYVWERGWRDWS
jgi:hypothetical protein